MPDHIEAPWTMEQVAALNRYQTGEGWPLRMHPFTCGQREGHPVVGGDAGILVATRLGWLCPYCTYTQRWAHAFMALPAPVLTADQQAALQSLWAKSSRRTEGDGERSRAADAGDQNQTMASPLPIEDEAR